MTSKIIITDCDHPSVDIEIEVLKQQGFEVVLKQCRTEEDVIKNCQDAVGLINQYAPITRKVLSSLPNCKVISRYGVGVDNIDLEAASDFGIQICNVPDYGVEEVSDHALALIFNLMRKTTLLSNDVKSGNWDFQICRPIRRMKDLTLGVVGIGRIGSAVARKANGMGWNVIGYDYQPSRYSPETNLVDFETLLKQSDIISIHVPLNNETHHMFNKYIFNKMKHNAIVVNTARGPIIHEEDLYRALKDGQIAGAALDVLEIEPPRKDHPLCQFDNVIMTPHAAWYSEEAAHELKRKAAEEVGKFINQEIINYPVNVLSVGRS
jgi:D-3-phosphoglycerate dehydrogenase